MFSLRNKKNGLKISSILPLIWSYGVQSINFLTFTLEFSTIQGQEDIVEILLAYGLEVTVTNLYGETPLHIACRRGNIGMNYREEFGF